MNPTTTVEEQISAVNMDNFHTLDQDRVISSLVFLLKLRRKLKKIKWTTQSEYMTELISCSPDLFAQPFQKIGRYLFDQFNRREDICGLEWCPEGQNLVLFVSPEGKGEKSTVVLSYEARL